MAIFSKTQFKYLLYLTLGTFIGLGFLSNSCSRQKNQAFQTVIPQFTVIINNNPAFQGDFIHGIQVKNVPSILITGIHNIVYKQWWAILTEKLWRRK